MKYVGKKSIFDISIFAELIVAIIAFVLMIISKDFRVIGLMVFSVCFWAIIVQIIKLKCYSVIVYEKSLTIKYGVFSRVENEIDLSNIASIKINQSLFGRIFGYGDLTIDIIGKGPTILRQIKKVNDLKTVLNQIRG